MELVKRIPFTSFLEVILSVSSPTGRPRVERRKREGSRERIGVDDDELGCRWISAMASEDDVPGTTDSTVVNKKRQGGEREVTRGSWDFWSGEIIRLDTPSGRRGWVGVGPLGLGKDPRCRVFRESSVS